MLNTLFCVNLSSGREITIKKCIFALKSTYNQPLSLVNNNDNEVTKLSSWSQRLAVFANSLKRNGHPKAISIMENKKQCSLKFYTKPIL